MKNPITSKKEVMISMIAMVVIFLALIRCISEVFRLNYYSTIAPTFIELKPFLIGALGAAIALFIMTILSFFGKTKTLVVISILTIIFLLIVKSVYSIP